MPAPDRILPSLLDRLTDDAPTEKRPEADGFTFDLSRYRAAVFRDLAMLLNTTVAPRTEEIDGLEEAQRSVINFGMPPLSGGTASSLDARGLERRIREVILRFEPRILPDGLVVRADVTPGRMNQRALVFRIEAMLWAQPVPEAIYVRTELDLESGHVTLAGSSSPEGR